ncbi:MAG TPA: hypothetical protein VEK85_01885, partial [Gemmatimonadales bacterium]|nr:hypothetical protein [Gemmatimonadales bacterium]
MMTQACSERDSLPHAAFLQRLAGAPAATSLDARLGNGAFLALRLVDLLRPGGEAAHPDAFRYQHAATERMCRELPTAGTETGHLNGLVRSTAEAFRSRNPRQVVPALLAYAHYLEDELRLEEALDVLETLVAVGADQLGCSDAIAAQLRIGRVNRKLNRFDEADMAYALAGLLGEAAGDVHSVFLSRVGRALSVQARGNLAMAEQSFREIAAEARGSQEREIEAHSEHALGTTLLLRGQVAEAIIHVWRAFEFYEDEASRLRTLNDLGVMLLALGRVDDAERALTEVVRDGGARDNVSNALIELMHCASYRRDRMGFERRRVECESRSEEMPPNILADFCLKAGIGSARFGNFRKARAQLGEALKVATKSGLHELVFRIERIMAGLRDCATECETKPHTGAEPAISTEAL